MQAAEPALSSFTPRVGGVSEGFIPTMVPGTADSEGGRGKDVSTAASILSYHPWNKMLWILRILLSKYAGQFVDSVSKVQ
jgi:hypothetical protein